MATEHSGIADALADALTVLIKESTAASTAAKGALDAHTKSVDLQAVRIEALKTSVDELVTIRAQEVRVLEDESKRRLELREQEVKAIEDKSNGNWRVFDALRPALLPFLSALGVVVVGAIGAALNEYLGQDEPIPIVQEAPAVSPPVVQEVPSVQ